MTTGGNWRQALEEQAAAARLAEQRAIKVYRPAPSLGQSLRKALAPILKEAGPAPGTLAARWPEIVGPRLAGITEPLKVTPGRGGATLTVRAPSAAAPMIQHASEHILQRVNLASGTKIKTLKIVQSDVAADAKPRPRSRALTKEEQTALTRELAEVENPAVRKALAELGEAVLTWKQRGS